MRDELRHARAMLFGAMLLGCSSSPPPKPVAAPPLKRNPPFEAEVAGRKLVIRFADSRASDANVPPQILAIDLDGTSLFPRDCAAKSKTKLLACSSAHRAVKDATEFHLVANHATDNQLQLLVAGRSGSNVECGVHDYWLLRVDKSGASATEPAAGCFTMPSSDPDAQNPVVDWGGSALTVKTFDEKSSSCSLVLPAGSSGWKITRAKKP